MDTYVGSATLADGAGNLRSVHIDVVWQDDRWWGSIVCEVNMVEWVGQPLVLRIDDHPEAAFALPSMGIQSGTGRWAGHFEGSGEPPFWSEKSRDDLLGELRRRRMVARSVDPGGEPPSFPVPDKVRQELREILSERDGLTEQEIDSALP